MSGEVEAIVAAAIASTTPSELDPEKRYVIVDPTESGGVEVIEPVPDRDRLAPRRVSGTSVVADVPSLKILWDKHSVPTSEVFADEAACRVVAVLNADEGAGAVPGFRDHRIELVLKHTLAWKLWLANDGKLLDQHAFAELIEDRVIDVVEPSGADMLELAQTFEATTKAQFKSATPLASGARQFQFEETIAAKAGEQGRMEIPASFVIAVQPFEGGDAFRVTARFRYRLREGRLAIGYKLERPEDVLRAAFADVIEKVSDATGSEVVKGTAPAAR